MTVKQANLLAKWLDRWPRYREAMRYFDRLFNGKLPLDTLTTMCVPTRIRKRIMGEI